MSVEKIVKVTCVSTKTENVYAQELKEKNVLAAVYIRGLQGAKGDAGKDGESTIQAATDEDINKLFE